MNSGYILLEGAKQSVVIDDDKITILFSTYSSEKIKQCSDRWFDVFEPNSRKKEHRCCYIVRSQDYSLTAGSEITFRIRFWFYKYEDDRKPSEIMVVSDGFTNFFNEPVLAHSSERFGKNEVYSTLVTINKREYSIFFTNEKRLEELDNRNNLFPFVPTTVCTIKSKEKLGEDDIMPIYTYLSRMLQFVTFNNYTRIDYFSFVFSDGGQSLINETNKTNNEKARMNEYLSFSAFSKRSAQQLMVFFCDYIKKPYNLYHRSGYCVYESDIPVMTGQFEYLFREFVEHSEGFKKEKAKKDKTIHKEELMKMLDQFKSDFNVSGEDFSSLKTEINRHGDSLFSKLDFIFKDFCLTIQLKPIKIPPLYSPVDFAKRLKNTRNSFCHGVYEKPISLEYGDDSFVLQELMYFIILKYSVKCSGDELRKIFTSGFFIERNLDLGFESQEQA